LICYINISYRHRELLALAEKYFAFWAYEITLE
jgi:hypothetical protein